MDGVELVKLIEQHGITVVVLLWFMLRAEKRLDRLSQLLESTVTAVAALAKAVEGIDRELSNGHTPPQLEEPDPPQPRRRAGTRGGA